MYELRRKSQVAYEDLMRELELIEQRLLKEDGAIAMDLMVLEARLRERFQEFEGLLHSPKASESNGLSIEDIQALIPQEIPSFPTIEDLETSRRRKKIIETVSTAAMLAIFTALGVFGLASVLQLGLSWLA